MEGEPEGPSQARLPSSTEWREKRVLVVVAQIFQKVKPVTLRGVAAFTVFAPQFKLLLVPERVRFIVTT